MSEITKEQEDSSSVHVFFCYAHEDDDLRRHLDGHLSILKHSKLIRSWYDGEIRPGAEWEEAIHEQLNKSDIVVLLISPSFLASEYCYNVEMKKALSRHEAGEARVIPIILRPVDWEGAPFRKLQMLPKDARPVTKWEDRDEALLNIAQGIRGAVLELLAFRGLSAGGVLDRIRRVQQERIDRDRAGGVDRGGDPYALLAVQEKTVEFLQNEYTALEDEYRRLQQEVEILRVEREDFDERLEHAVQGAAKRASSAEEKCVELQQKVDEQVEIINGLKADYSRLRAEAMEKIDKLMDRIKELNGRLMENTQQQQQRPKGIFR
ncbi:MAG TPA: TIR domain-containing protein [Thermoanaerobaculia bacterium]|nr:TIR domain-containing protein [Thermoanaerobaculia bacterium]